MSSNLKVNNILPTSGGGTVNLGASGDTITVPSGVSLSLPNNTVTSASMFSGFKNGITMADQWRLTANFTGDANPIASNLERNDNPSFGYIGTGMTESSGIFTFPETGIYQVEFVATLARVSTDAIVNFQIEGTTDNSSYSILSRNFSHTGTTASSYSEITTSSFFDVTDTSTHKVRFGVSSSSQNVVGSSTQNSTYMTFIRLGDT